MHVCPWLEPDARSLVCANGEWRRNNSGGFYSDGLKEGQDIVTINCKGGQPLGCGRLGGGLLGPAGLLCLSGGRLGKGLFRFSRLLCFRDFRGLHHHDAIVVASSSASLGGAASEAPLRDRAGEYLQEFSCV